jgi:UDP-N-acetylmuramoylalanine-D-glutamate ligase
VGLGVSNMAVIRYLAGRGARLTGFDQKTEQALGAKAEELRRLGVRLVLGPDYLERLDGAWDAVFLTPGMPKNAPALQRLRERGVPFFSEVGLFFRCARRPSWASRAAAAKRRYDAGRRDAAAGAAPGLRGRQHRAAAAGGGRGHPRRRLGRAGAVQLPAGDAGPEPACGCRHQRDAEPPGRARHDGGVRGREAAHLRVPAAR